MKKYRFLLIILLLHTFPVLISAEITKPEDFLGFKIGSDRQLADMHQIQEYFGKLNKESKKISVFKIGETTLGNPFIAAIITAEKNHRRLEKLQEYQQLLADPRKITDDEADKIIADGKTVVMINCSIHATEIGASQMSMQLAYDLITRSDALTAQILDNVILLLIPMHNPDGIQMVVDWYKQNLGTEYEGCRMPWLYHKYVGHDNNRDWYMLTQIESRLTIKLHNAWHPQIVLDMHQMGQKGPRIFVPPYVDPFEPNVDPILRQQVAMMGTFIASELTAQGKAGVMHSQWFDAWTPARAYHHYHGGIRILTELASVDVATPVTISFDDLYPFAQTPSVKMPLPWMGGEWRFQDIVEYDQAAAWAVLTNAASLRENWLRNFYRVHKNEVAFHSNPHAFLIPEDQSDLPSTLRMLEVLQLGGVEIHQATGAFTAEGKVFPSGTFIVFRSQPYGGYAKALLEKQVYPEIREYQDGPLKTPYDVVAHTLPLLMGVKVIQVNEPFDVESREIRALENDSGSINDQDQAAGFIWGHSTNDDMAALNLLLDSGFEVSWATECFKYAGQSHPAGTMYVRNEKGLFEKLQEISQDFLVHFKGIQDIPSVKRLDLKPVRLGLYKSWTAPMNEGWTRWVLEQHSFPYKSLHDKAIREGGLENDFDVILLPDMREQSIREGLAKEDVPPEYSGGIGEIGVENIREFVRKGGTLICVNASTDFAIKNLHLDVANEVKDLDRKDFFIPGSLLKVLNDPDHPITYGYGRDASVFFRRSPVFSVFEGNAVVTYPTDCLQSGWINGEEHLRHKAAVVDVPFEKGKVILIGFPVLYRAQSHGTFRYLFNAITYGGAD